MEMRATVAGDPAATVQDGAGLPSGHQSHHAVVWLATALTAAGYSVFALARYYTFGTGSAPAGARTAQAAPG